MFNKRPAKAKADDANPVKAKVVKLTPAELLANEHPRKIMIIIKSTGFYKFKPEDGDRLTEIACIETLHGEPTGQAFHAFIRLEDAALQAKHFEYCRATLKQKKKTTEGELLCQNLSEARPFSEVQPALLAFLQRNPETTILTHPKGYILDFLRHAMDKAGNEQLVILQNSMIDMRSKAAALSHLGLYKGGLFQNQVDSDRAAYKEGRTFYKLQDQCDGFGVRLTNYSGFSAKRDAELLVQVDKQMQYLQARQAEADAEKAAKAAPLSAERRMRK